MLDFFQILHINQIFPKKSGYHFYSFTIPLNWFNIVKKYQNSS